MSIPGDRRDRIGRFITSDVFVFEDPRRIRRNLYIIMAALLAASSSIAAYGYIIGWTATFETAFAATLAFVAVTILLWRGYPRLAGIIMLLSLLAAVNHGIVMGDGIHDVAVVIYPAVIVLGSLLLNTRFFILLTLLVISSAAAIGVLEIRGTIINKFTGTFEYPEVVIIGLMLTAEAVVIRLLATVISDSLVRAHRSERSYMEIFNATSEAIFVHDAEGEAIIDVNQTALAMFGYARGEMLELTPADLTPDEFRTDSSQKLLMISKAIEPGPRVYERLLQRKDGTRFWADVSLHSAQIGGQMRLLSVLRDVDQRKRMEERLRQSEKLEAIGQLAGGVAHDFNNQLAGIVGYADLIRADAKEGSDLANNLDRILVAAKRATELTGQLLAFARRGKYESSAVDVNDLVEEVVSLIEHSLDRRITIIKSLAARDLHTLGDATQLQSALLNLAINARDAMPEGGTLTITTRVLELDDDHPLVGESLPPGRYVQLEVADTGTGMDEETRQRIFEPFFTTKPRGKGTGMGLAAVYGTVKNHGGTIGVNSETRCGSVFTILLPLYEGPILPDERRSPPQQQRAKARVLLVDDEEEICRLASRILEKQGYQPVVRSDAVGAVEYYRDAWRDIDLVVLDMVMPGMSGRDTYLTIRDINPDAVVLLTSGFSIDEEIQGLIDSGAAGFIQKPFWSNQFIGAIADALRRGTKRAVAEPGEA